MSEGFDETRHVAEFGRVVTAYANTNTPNEVEAKLNEARTEMETCLGGLTTAGVRFDEESIRVLDFPTTDPQGFHLVGWRAYSLKTDGE